MPPPTPERQPNPASSALDEWFVSEVLPLEGLLVAVIRRHWREADEVADLRQEVFARVYESAAARRPECAQAFVITTARNLLIDRARRSQVVSFETVADLETLDLPSDDLTPERHASGRQELAIFVKALDALPQRCREVVSLRKLSGLSQRDVAHKMGIAEDTVEKQVAKGMTALAEALLVQGVDVGPWAFRKRPLHRREFV